MIVLDEGTDRPYSPESFMPMSPVYLDFVPPKPPKGHKPVQPAGSSQPAGKSTPAQEEKKSQKEKPSKTTEKQGKDKPPKKVKLPLPRIPSPEIPMTPYLPENFEPLEISAPNEEKFINAKAEQQRKHKAKHKQPGKLFEIISLMWSNKGLITGFHCISL